MLVVYGTKVDSVLQRSKFIAQAANNRQCVTLLSARPRSNATLAIARAHRLHESLTICWSGVEGRVAERNRVSERHGEHGTKSAFYGFSKTPKQKICLFACSMMGRLG